MRSNFLLHVTVILLVSAPLAGWYSPVPCRGSERTVAVLTFRNNAGENSDYIAAGVRDMIASRVTYIPSIRVVEQSLVKDELSKLHSPVVTSDALVEIGRALGVEYVVSGSISERGGKLFIDASVLTVSKGGDPTPVFSQGMGLDDVIPKMPALVQGINGALSREAEAVTGEAAGVPPQPGGDTFPRGGVTGSGVGGVSGSTGTGTSPEVAKPRVDRVHGEGEPPETAEESGTRSEFFGKRFLQRKSRVDSTDENPAYRKSIDDIKGSAQTGTEEKPR